ncbi:hypothetical protein KQI42_09330 [Tissierella sp. MSJ-40]|uniref:Uncharacterized protein n=1 Tax=Tissierella simiarum TaxID=2841534 RepID=A0ABS6E5L6_9FIRM|nr:hypothetical protein [Tissierella simiarum]MBU5438210.1 hypothetical protein [Tissierella simiarum]
MNDWNKKLGILPTPFTVKENNFLKVALEKYIKEGTSYEREIANKMLGKFIDLEIKKKYFCETKEQILG